MDQFSRTLSPGDPQAILESITDGFSAVNHEWQFIYVNGQAESLLDRQPGDLLGRNIWDEYPGLIGSEFEAVYRRVAAERIMLSTCAFYPEHDRWYEVRVFPAPYGISIYFNDSSERKRAEAERVRLAAASEQQRLIYETALSSTADFNYVFDLDGRFTYVNRALLALWQKELPEALGKNFFELDYPPELAARLQAQIQQTASSGQPVRDETPYTSAVAGTRAYEYIFVPVTDAHGKVVAVSGSTRDITERKEAEESLKQSDRRKDEFLATLAHELRNPLAPLRSGLQIMRLAKGDPVATEAARDMMERQLAHMVRLVDDLMDASRISRGHVELCPQRIPLAEGLQLALETVQPLLAESAHELDVQLPAIPVFVNADPARLAQVFSNLLSNAIKFTEPGGKIKLSAQLEGDEVMVRVADNGIGIAPDLQPTVFDMFAQADASAGRPRGGLGIGLSLAKGLVELHHGQIEVHSEGRGAGSEFIVRLPVVEAPQRAAPVASANDNAPAHGKVLVVDDNTDAAESMAEILAMEGHDTRIAHNGLDALALAESFRPDVIFLDIGMPHLNGYETAQRIREHAWGERMALVALTGWGSDRDRERSHSAGFDHHLVKPGGLAEIERIIGATMRTRNAS